MAIALFYLSPFANFIGVFTRITVLHICHWYETAIQSVSCLIFRINRKNIIHFNPHPIIGNDVMRFIRLSLL